MVDLLFPRWIITLIFSALFGVPAFVIHLTFYYTHSTQVVFPGLSVANLVLFTLATVVQVCICVCLCVCVCMCMHIVSVHLHKCYMYFTYLDIWRAPVLCVGI